MKVSPFAGKPAEPLDAGECAEAGHGLLHRMPDPSVPAQRVAFGTSGHRGSAFDSAFNEWHILAISQAICLYRHSDNGSTVRCFSAWIRMRSRCRRWRAPSRCWRPTGWKSCSRREMNTRRRPLISHAILTYNRGRKPDSRTVSSSRLRTIRPMTAASNTTRRTAVRRSWTYRLDRAKANEFLESGLQGVKRLPFEGPSRLHHAPARLLGAYIGDLGNVIDMDVIRGAKISLGVDPLGGAGVHYWGPIAERYGLNLTVVNEAVDPTFRFMTVDWDGQIRMDPSSPYAMQRLIGMKDRFDIAFACDTDHDRHGIVTKSAGLLPPNHYLSVAIYYLFQHRPKWRKDAAVGKTVVSSQMIDRVAAKLGRKLYEVPVGFKWFVDGLLDGSLGFGGEESAGASFVRLDGTVWTTDKDGIVPALLAAEITARMGRDPGEIYRDLTRELGEPVYDRVEAPATPEQKEILAKLSPQQVSSPSWPARKSRRSSRARRATARPSAG